MWKTKRTPGADASGVRCALFMKSEEQILAGVLGLHGDAQAQLAQGALVGAIVKNCLSSCWVLFCG